MSKPKVLSWENFRATVFVRGEERVHRITDSPGMDVFGDGITNRIGIWLDVPSGTSIPPELTKLALVTTRTSKQKGRFILEVATATQSLFRQFYHFAVAVAERVMVEKLPAVDALVLELQCFADLLGERPILGIERQIGLLGELIFLEHLMNHRDTGSLDSWLGPKGEPHDFRMQSHEFEVKSTVSPHRIHTIHGTEQLVPSKGCKLYLVSIVFGPPGAEKGFSLMSKVAELSKRFAPRPDQLARFSAALEACGFHDSDRAHYNRCFVMRRPIGLARVDSKFPAITRPTIQNALGPLAPRVDSLQYDVNIEGLEHEDGTKEFVSAIPV